MPTYRITSPSGDVFEITAPDGATQEQVLAYAKKNMGAAAQPLQAEPPIDPSEGGTNLRPFGFDTGIQMPQGVSRFLAGAGKSMVDVGRGAGQMLGLVDRKSVDDSKRLDAPLMDTGSGVVGNVLGNVAMALPAALAGPAAATIAAQAGLGAVQGALQPAGTDDSRIRNIAMGGAIGAALPAALRAGKVLKAGFVDPFTEAGRNRIVGGALNRAASDPAEARANLQMARGATPGFNPTAGQASNDAGIASLERAARAIDPGGFGDIDATQRAALVQALRSISRVPEDRAAAVVAREQAVAPLYDAAKRAVVPGDDEITELLKRPSMTAATRRAGKLAAERGEKFAITPGEPARTVQTGLLDANGAPLVQQVPAQPGQLQGRALHDLKMGLDDAIGAPGLGGMQGAERNAAIGTREQYMQWLENRIPEYAQAKSTYAGMSRPINQMDIGQELYKRFVPALADGSAVPFRANAQSLAQALRNGDKLAQNVTGMSGAKMANIMEPAQMDLLQGVVSDSQMKAAAETVGRGVGSDTVQKLAMSNLIDQAGLPTWIGALAPLRSVGGMARTIGDIVYTKNDETMRHLMADVLKDPKRAAEAMKAAGVRPSQLAEYLRRAGAAANQAVTATALDAQN
jgi:hypothetical protein